MNCINSLGHLKIVKSIAVFPTATQVLSKAGVTFSTNGGTSYTETASVSGLTYGSFSVTGTYTAKCSTSYQSGQANETCGQAFRGAGYHFVSSISKYNSSTGAYVGATSTTISGSNYNGEWLQIQVPFSFILKYYSNMPHTASNAIFSKTIILAGSNDGTTWSLLGTINATTYTQTNATLSGNTTAYSYYRFVVTLIASGETTCGFQNVILQS